MSDKHNNSSDEQVRAVPQYRVRKPEGGTSAPKFAQNAAASPSTTSAAVPNADGQKPANPGKTSAKAKEIGGPKGLEPTRFGDWERDGRCVDF